MLNEITQLDKSAESLLDAPLEKIDLEQASQMGAALLEKIKQTIPKPEDMLKGLSQGDSGLRAVSNLLAGNLTRDDLFHRKEMLCILKVLDCFTEYNCFREASGNAAALIRIIAQGRHPEQIESFCSLLKQPWFREKAEQNTPDAARFLNYIRGYPESFEKALKQPAEAKSFFEAVIRLDATPWIQKIRSESLPEQTDGIGQILMADLGEFHRTFFEAAYQNPELALTFIELPQFQKAVEMNSGNAGGFLKIANQKPEVSRLFSAQSWFQELLPCGEYAFNDATPFLRLAIQLEPRVVERVIPQPWFQELAENNWQHARYILSVIDEYLDAETPLLEQKWFQKMASCGVPSVAHTFLHTIQSNPATAERFAETPWFQTVLGEYIKIQEKESDLSNAIKVKDSLRLNDPNFYKKTQKYEEAQSQLDRSKTFEDFLTAVIRYPDDATKHFAKFDLVPPNSTEEVWDAIKTFLKSTSK